MAKWYLLQLGKAVSATPTDAQVFCLWMATNSSSSQSRKWVIKTWRVKKVRLTLRHWTVWSNELSSAYLDKNWSAVATISTNIQHDQEHRTYEIDCDIPVTALTDYLNIRLACATWLTNPLQMVLNWSARIEY